MRAQRVGEILVTRHLLTPEQLVAGIEQQASVPTVRIGDAMKSFGLISQPQLDEALAQQARDRSVPLGRLGSGGCADRRSNRAIAIGVGSNSGQRCCRRPG